MSPIKDEPSDIVGAVEDQDVKPSIMSLVSQSGNKTRTRRQRDTMPAIKPPSEDSEKIKAETQDQDVKPSVTYAP